MTNSSTLESTALNLTNSQRSGMSFRVLSLAGIVVAFLCYGVATSLYPGGYDWNHYYVSTMLRGASNLSRNIAIAGLAVYAVCIAMVFERLSRTIKSTVCSKLVQTGGIGSMVYSALAFTVLHDLMVTISVGFFAVAVLALLYALYVSGEKAFFTAGAALFAMFAACVAIYYADRFTFLLPWGQRMSFSLFAVWLVCMDFRVSRLGAAKMESV